MDEWWITFVHTEAKLVQEDDGGGMNKMALPSIHLHL